MNRQVYDFKFIETVPLDEAEETLQMSLVAAECLYGDAQVKLDSNYYINKKSRAIAVESETEVGLDVCRLFTGFLNREFGEHAFQVTSRLLSPKEVTS